MKNSTILLTTDPKGRFMEGIIDDTSKPGMFVEEVPNTAFVGGRPHWRARTIADGGIGPLYLLLDDPLQGFLPTTAYAAGKQCFVYALQPGDEFNGLVGDVSGTGDIITQGDVYGVANGGKLKKNSSFASAPFEAQETLPALVADALVFFQVRGVAA